MNQQQYIDALHESKRKLQAANDAAASAYLEQKTIAGQAFLAGMSGRDIMQAIGHTAAYLHVMLAEAEATVSHHRWTAAEITGDKPRNAQPGKRSQRRSRNS